MTLRQSNPYLRQASARKAALRVSAQSSFAVEGISAPFAKRRKAPADAEAFIALWKRRVALEIGDDGLGSAPCEVDLTGHDVAPTGYLVQTRLVALRSNRDDDYDSL